MSVGEIEKKANLRLLDAVSNGGIADYTIGESDNNPEDGERWGDNRKLMASLVREVCLGKHRQAPLDARGVRVKGARISGELDFSWVDLRIPVLFEDCYFDSPIKFVQARTKTIDFNGSFMKYGIDGDGLHADGDVYIQNIISRGAIEFPGSRVGGRMNFNGADIFSPRSNDKLESGERVIPDEDWWYKKGMAIALSQAKIENGLFLREGNRKFTCDGYIEMRGMELRGNLEIEGTLKQFPGALRENFALDMDGATVSGTIFLRNLSISGKVYCSGVRSHLLVMKSLKIGIADDSDGDDYLVDASRMKIDSHIHIYQDVEVDGGFDFSSSRIGGEFCIGKRCKNHGCTGDDIGTLNRFPIVAGIISLKHVWAGQFRVDIEKWISSCSHSDKPVKAWLDGFEFSAITDSDGHPIKADHEGTIFLDWLKTNDVSSGGDPNREADKARFRPQPHEHLAGTLERMGYSDASKKIKMDKAKNEIEDLVANSRFPRRIFLIFQNSYLKIVGYGHNVKYAFLTSFIIILVCSMVYLDAYRSDGMGISREYVYLQDENRMQMGLLYKESEYGIYELFLFQNYKCKKEPHDNKTDCWPPSEYTNFNAFLYSIDAFLPLVNLHQEESWLPKTGGWGTVAWVVLWFEILAGWFLSTLIVASLTGIIKKD